MYFQNEFAQRVNEAVEHLCSARFHAPGEHVVVVVAAQEGFCPSIDGIELDDANVYCILDKKVRDDNGNEIFEIPETEGTIFAIEGNIRS